MACRHVLASFLSCLFCSSLAVGFLLGCSGKVDSNSIGGAGADSESTDPALLFDGLITRTYWDGYWWTYTDHNPADSEYHASVDPVTSLTVPLGTTTDGAVHGSVFRIHGSVPQALTWADVATQKASTIDQYWLEIYADSRIPAYPAAGIGLTLKAYSAPTDATGGGKWLGIAFDLKLNAPTPMFYVSLPIVGTDLPDPHMRDAFQKQCQYYTVENQPASGYQTCFADYRKGFRDETTSVNEYGTLGTVGTWKRLCVLYSEVGTPSWAGAVTMENVPPFDPMKLLKIRWDMYQPAEIDSSGTFDISVDNVRFITEAEARDASNNCDPTMIGQPAGTGGEG